MEILKTTTAPPPDAAFLKQMNNRKQMLRLLEIVRHPIKFFISDYTIPMIVGCLLAGVVFLSYLTGGFAKIFPSFTFQALICVMGIAA